MRAFFYVFIRKDNVCGIMLLFIHTFTFGLHVPLNDKKERECL